MHIFLKYCHFLNHQCSIWVLLNTGLNVLLSQIKLWCPTAFLSRSGKVNIWVNITTIYQRVVFLEFTAQSYFPSYPTILVSESLLEHLLTCVNKWMSHGRILSRRFLPWIKKLKFWIHCRAKQNCSGEILLSHRHRYLHTVVYLCGCPRMFRLGCIWVQSFCHSVWCAHISIFP